jgi:hypothetical protein
MCPTPDESLLKKHGPPPLPPKPQPAPPAPPTR